MLHHLTCHRFAHLKSVSGWWRSVAQQNFQKKTKQKNVSYCIKLKSSIVCVFLPALQVYLGCQRRFSMLFLTYLNKTLFFALSIYGNDQQSQFFIFYYTKSKMAFKITFCIIRKLVKCLKIRLLKTFEVFFLRYKLIFL